MSKILLISANAVFAKDLKLQLERHQEWEVREEYAADDIFDAAVVDDDIGKLRELHEKLLQTPLFLLCSEKNEPAGDANIYVIHKPFRLEALIDALHTAVNTSPAAGGELQLCGCRLNISAREVLYPDGREPVKLTERETAILKYLYKAGDKIVGKAELLAEVWGYNPEATTHTVETHIYRLRQKLEQPEQIVMTEDNGYRLQKGKN